MSVSIDDEEIRDLLKRLPVESFNIVKSNIQGSILAIDTDVKNNFNGGAGLYSRTGQLRRSMMMKITGNTLGTLDGRVVAGGGSNEIKYAILQEQGGNVRPTRNKYMGVPGGPYINIPLSANKTAAGVMRESAQMVFAAGGYIIKSHSGKYIVMSGTNKPMFVLSKGTTVPPRLGMKKAMDKEVPTLLSNIYNSLTAIL